MRSYFIFKEHKITLNTLPGSNLISTELNKTRVEKNIKDTTKHLIKQTSKTTNNFIRHSFFINNVAQPFCFSLNSKPFCFSLNSKPFCFSLNSKPFCFSLNSKPFCFSLNSKMLQAKKSFYQSISRLYDKTIDNRSLPKSIKKQKFIYRNLQKLYLADTTINNFFQVCFIFSCFEKQDLKLAFNLFQKYLASLTNYLKTYNDLKTVHEKDKTNLRAAWTQTRLQNQQLPNSKLNFKQSVAYLKLVGSLNENLNSTEVSMPTKLYTVIRSPHVFKKTREQFAITKYKRVVKLVFKSKSALKILVDSFVLLKLPAEVKIIIRNK